ncbi:MAG: glycine--tRNA ligase subunit beta [Rubrivivax sp.]
MTAKNLLVELLVEELPPQALNKLGEAFATLLADSLKAQGLAPADACITAFATPRRLAVHVDRVLPVAPDHEVMRKVMPVSVAFDAQQRPTPALNKALGKLGRTGLADKWPDANDGPDELLVRPDGKSDALFLRSMAKGVALLVGLQTALDEAIAKLPIPKVMSYQLADGWSSVSFVRPAHGLVALHGDAVVGVHALGLDAQRTTQGHRFEAAIPAMDLRSADSYVEQMQADGAVIPGFAARRAEIVRQLHAAADTLGLRPIDDDALLDEVTGLVERPNVLACEFDAEFLGVPSECLILTMKANQKYFPLLDAQGKLTHHFLVVSNIRPADPSRIIEGNQRVVRPRLADAKFFFDQDRKRTLESRVPGLDKVVYHGKLGTQGERMQRVRMLARVIAQQLGDAALVRDAERAALLAKTDLLTDMVGEFPELQGIMGGYYARHDGEAEAVAQAIEDHYKPRFAGDSLPREHAGVVLALADKLETLAGLFGIGALPSGDRDPFALRRHALGVIRMLIEAELPLRVEALVAQAFDVFGAAHGQAQQALLDFMRERLVGYLRERDSSAQQVDAVLALQPQIWAELPPRLAALRSFAALPEAGALAAANKRVANILRKADAPPAAQVDEALLREPAEAALHAAVAAVRPVADAAFERGDHAASLHALAALKAPVDAFFDAVMVNADDAALRANRLALLAALHAAMNRVADLSRLAS